MEQVAGISVQRLFLFGDISIVLEMVFLETPVIKLEQNLPEHRP
jgi:hypothetical protein